MKRSQAELVKMMTKNEGYSFRDFTLIHEGDYEVSDADWNYKDVPHLKEIHHLVEGYPASIANDFVAAIFVQKVFGLKVPITVFNYQSGLNRQTYYTTLFFFILIVETSYESLAPSRTRVSTKYALGSKPIFQFLFPLARLAITRNYENLMTGDIPMRLRRGQLRKWGYSFKGDHKPYSFLETSSIMEANVIAPAVDEKPPEMTFDLLSNDRFLYGRADRYGLSLFKQANQLHVFQRLCPHEGADLTVNACVDNNVKCPWHGRKFSALLKIDLTLASGQWQLGLHTLKLANQKLSVIVSDE